MELFVPHDSKPGLKCQSHDKHLANSFPLKKPWKIILSLRLLITPLCHSSSYKSLLFCTTWRRALLAAGWDAVWFKNHLRELIRDSDVLSWVLFFSKSVAMRSEVNFWWHLGARRNIGEAPCDPLSSLPFSHFQGLLVSSSWLTSTFLPLSSRSNWLFRQ